IVNAGILLFQRYNPFRRFIHRLIAPLKRSLLYKMVASIRLSSSIHKGARQARLYMGQNGPGSPVLPLVYYIVGYCEKLKIGIVPSNNNIKLPFDMGVK